MNNRLYLVLVQRLASKLPGLRLAVENVRPQEL